jgi:hypothetical protein
LLAPARRGSLGSSQRTALTPSHLPGPLSPRGWQWLFLLEGVPSILLGMLVFLLLPSSVETARFLTPEERTALAVAIERDHVPGPLGKDLRSALAMVGAVARNGYLWLAGTCGALTSVASHTYLAYTPIIVSNMLAGTALSNSATVAAAPGSKDLRPVALSIVPFATAVVASYLVAHSAQRRDEQFWHVAGCLLVAGIVLALFPPLTKAALGAGFASLAISLAAGASANGPAMALVARLCKGREQVVALPMFSSMSVIGGIIGPLVTGVLMSRLVRPTRARAAQPAGREGAGHAPLRRRAQGAAAGGLCPGPARSPSVPPPQFAPLSPLLQGGFTWVTIIMGVLMSVTGLLVLVLRAWVMHDGGPPDGGMRRYRSEISATVPPGVPAGADDICVVLGKPGSPRPPPPAPAKA